MLDLDQYKVARSKAVAELTGLLDQRNALDLQMMKLKHTAMTLTALIEDDQLELPDMGSIHGKRQILKQAPKSKR